MTRRFAFFSIVFIALNIAFIPLLGAYGLSVCPVLRQSGFFSGCSYSTMFVIIVCGLNLPLTYYQLVSKSKPKPWLTPIFYLSATIAALIVLENLLGVNHSSMQSQAPQLLIIASCLLGITQYYGMAWVRVDSSEEVQQETTVNRAWINHSIKGFLPTFASTVVLVHFVGTQGRMAKNSFATIETMVSDSRVLILFTLGWMLTTYLFLFLSEKDSVGKISALLDSIKTGSFDEKKSFSSWGLWNYLGNSIRIFGKTFNERERVLKSFSRFVSNEVVNKSIKEEISTVSGDRVELTIIMTDIRGFSGISEQLPAEKVIAFLNEYFELVIRTFLEHNIHIDKFIGDGILAYVRPGNNSIEENTRAVQACNALIEALPALNQNYKIKGLPELKIGGGITRGEVIRGMIGSSDRLEHTIIGDSVNRAARLESITKDHGVSLILSEDVYNDCEKLHLNLYRSLGVSKLKGIDQEFAVYGR